WFKRAEAVRHYERGRADMQAAHAFGAIPQSFGSSPPVVLPTIEDTRPRQRSLERINRPEHFTDVERSDPIGDRVIDEHAYGRGKIDAAIGPVESPASLLRFSEALAVYEAEDTE